MHLMQEKFLLVIVTIMAQKMTKQHSVPVRYLSWRTAQSNPVSDIVDRLVPSPRAM